MYRLTPAAEDLYQGIRDLPIISPHGHCDPAWFAMNQPFANPAELLVTPDHYVFRMLYSRGVPLAELGVGAPGAGADPREIFRLFARHWNLFLGTPSRLWIEHVLYHTLRIETALSETTADAVYDQIADRLAQEDHLPRRLFDRFGIEVLATTDGALDDLAHHRTIRDSDWDGSVVPTFRPDGVLDPTTPGFSVNIRNLGEMTGCDTGHFAGYLQALRHRRNAFRQLGATATDHAIEVIHTEWLTDPEPLFQRVKDGTVSSRDSTRFYGHMLIEMAQMSVEDGMVMQLHAGSRRNTNRNIHTAFGRDMGADIPVATDWVRGLESLLDRVGNEPELRLILFTLDETSYARELAPMAGHWPALRIGPPWWFHDSPAGIARYFDQVVETAGYHNLAGFNDDTRAFLSIPARHDLWRRAVADHLAGQVAKGYFGPGDARSLARLLTVDLARETYSLGQ